VSYTKGQIRKITEDIIELTTSGLSLPQACKKLNISVSAGTKWAKMSGNYKPAWNPAELSGKKKYDLENLDSDCGIYAIVFHPTGFDKNNQISRCYIGSSVDTKKRIQAHLRDSKNNKHYNSDFQKCFNKGMQFHAYLLEPCDEDDLLTIEEQWRSKYCEGSIINKNKAVTLEQLKPWLEVAKETNFHDGKYTVNEETGCWEWNVLDRDRYGNSIQAKIKGKKTKYIRPHRLSYYVHKGEYPELVRHLCNNKSCVNPDHLESGSHRQNGLDNSEELRKEFEYWWLRYERDIKKLTDHFDWNSTGVALGWERKLGLREKYPDIYWENTRFLHPEEKQKQKEKKRLRRELRREKESINALEYKERAINLKRRFGGNAKEISEYLGLSHYKVQQMVKGVEEPWRELWDQDWFCTIPYDQVDVKYVQSLQKQHPEYKKQIEDYYSRIMFPLEAGLFCSFRCARYRRRA
jgi:hypothetical protein